MQLTKHTQKILLVVHVVHCQTSYLKMLAMILIMNQMLILLRQNHAFLPKARGIKQSETSVMISKLESQQTYGKSIKIFRIVVAAQYIDYIEYLMFKYLIFFFLYLHLAIIYCIYFERKIKMPTFHPLFLFFGLNVILGYLEYLKIQNTCERT